MIVGTSYLFSGFYLVLLALTVVLSLRIAMAREHLEVLKQQSILPSSAAGGSPSARARRRSPPS